MIDLPTGEATIPDGDTHAATARPRLRPRQRLTSRVIAGIAAAACLTLLVTAATLPPDARGHGTHTRLGMPPCAFSLTFDRPCPTCGMTTAFAHAAQGRLFDAFHAQPLGAMLALLVSAAFWVSAHVAATGSAIGRYIGKAITPARLWLLGGSILAAWAYKWVTWTGS